MTRSTSQIDLIHETQLVGLFLNDGTGRFHEGTMVPMGSTPGSLQTVQDNRWVTGGASVIVPTLWPVKLDGSDVIYANQQVLSGSGQPGAKVTISAAGSPIGQTLVGSGGQWSVSVQPLLTLGFHAITITTADDAGQLSAPVEQTILVVPAQKAWHNSTNPYDVDGNKFVSPIDVLLVIDELNKRGGYLLPDSRPALKPFYDVTGDGYISPIDVLRVIDYLNRRGEGEMTGADGEGETADVTTGTQPTFARGLSGIPRPTALSALQGDTKTVTERRDQSPVRNWLSSLNPIEPAAPAVGELDAWNTLRLRRAGRHLASRPSVIAEEPVVAEDQAGVWQDDENWLDA